MMNSERGPDISKPKLKCEYCGSEDESVEETVDPYADEIHNDQTPVDLCEGCVGTSAQDI